MYRAGLESILGFKLRGDRLQIEPCIPRFWREFEIVYKRGSATYNVVVENPHGLNRGVSRIEVDGVHSGAEQIELVDDGKPHVVRVTLDVVTAEV
jgi:cyclic beta-1,2-glucan synthetase